MLNDIPPFELLDGSVLKHAAQTAFAVGAVLALRTAALARIERGAKVLTRRQRCQTFTVRSLAATALALAVGTIWLAELQALLLSLTAVIVAFVIATKELIQCVSGSLVRSAGGLFRVGDWIEIDGVRGEVVGHSLLSTTILEMENERFGYGLTGRSLVLPNSHLFTTRVCVRRHGRRFVPHRFDVTFEPNRAVEATLAWWDRALDAAAAPFAAQAARHHSAVEKRLRGALTGPAPVATVSTTELGRVRVDVSIYCPTGEAAAIERSLKARFLDWQAELAAQSAGGATVLALADPRRFESAA